MISLFGKPEPTLLERLKESVGKTRTELAEAPEDRVGKGLGAGVDFSARADALKGATSSESRWPDTSILDCPKEDEKRFGSSEYRFANDDNRFTADGDNSPRFGSESGRWSGSRFHDNAGLDDRYNPIANY